jgi:predicted phosphoadenosine phosphosulfate sulfurtransferase
MTPTKKPIGKSVLEAARERIAWTFDNFERVYLSFSAGKDSTVMLHLVMDEAKARGRKVGMLLVDLEGQYKLTMDHAECMYKEYADHIEPYWCALPIALRNAVSVYEPKWLCWDPSCREAWIRPAPERAITRTDYFDWFHPGMERKESHALALLGLGRMKV